MRRWRRLAIAIAVGFGFLITNGCGSLYYLKESPEHKAMREAGYELCHLQSCGPQSLSNAFKYLGIDKEPFTIGKEIQDLDRTHYREIMSLVHHDFSKITCPPELKKYCRHIGLTITVIDDVNDLTEDDVAIVLLRGTNDFREWHYICYPEYSVSYILDYFGENTVFIKAYKLTK